MLNKNDTLLQSLTNDLRRALQMLGIIRTVTYTQDIYETAYASIGRDASPEDSAPDEYGCANSLSEVIARALPDLHFPIFLSTRTLYQYLLNSPSFKLVSTPTPGCIIISVTGTGNGSIPNGHCGVVGKQWIMSNDSRSGTWEANYTLDAWIRHYDIKGGMPTHYFSCA
jgi:hypothetical protein